MVLNTKLILCIKKLANFSILNNGSGIIIDTLGYVGFNTSFPKQKIHVVDNNINDLDKTEDWNEKKNAITSTSAIVYPNPNNGSFTINLPFDDNERYVVEIINTEGKRVFFKDDILSNDTYLNSNLNQGIYILKASSNNHSFVNKIVIN